ncbi:hypothetical protein GCM10009660_38450 [Catellatospora bangladeshensis]
MTRTIVAAALAANLLAACGEPTSPAPAPATSSSRAAEQHVLVLEVIGTAVLTSLVLTLDGESTEERGVQLPWTRTVTIPRGSGRHEWELVMRHSGGTLAATATVDGRLVTQTGGGGSPGSAGTARVTGSLEG